MDGKADLPRNFVARRLAAAYTIYLPLWAGALVLGSNLVAAAGFFHRHGLYMALVTVPVVLSGAAILYTALATFREAQSGTSFNRFSRHVLAQALALVGALLVTLVWYVAFNPLVFHWGDF